VPRSNREIMVAIEALRAELAERLAALDRRGGVLEQAVALISTYGVGALVTSRAVNAPGLGWSRTMIQAASP
jgi:hypothetical protein